MKIIKFGEKHLTWVGIKVSCFCGTVFELEKKDKETVKKLPAPRVDVYDDPEGKYYEFSVKCPVCRRDCEFDTKMPRTRRIKHKK